ncbi:pyridoxal phosphate-dependent aminotransferase [Burkholderia pyrrocinia]|uniref:pyridoxal phosphate-dependent aminotransferase n=1 Tax=Burkholderia pyrrocinia TaxID=60550 RepID=UPI00157599A2|nr:pyridoxal phosphate-dependent aminotransferase [Burkholderia pyrrocinia]NTX25820.1 pyridoxal phosphate-dependent aminotransferase [Burkholderia pyrrocinia]
MTHLPNIVSRSLLHLSSHMDKTGPSAISRVMAAVAERKRNGKKVIGLHVGEPDFDTPDHIKEAAIRAVQAGDTHYTAPDGSPAMKEAVQHKFHRDYDLKIELNEIVIAPGAKTLIFMALFATLDRGDEVILPAPYWGSYIDIIEMMGATAVVVPTRPEDAFRLHADDLEKAITPRTRWLLLNSPSNPSGTVYELEHYVPLLDVLENHPHVWLLADDMYEHIVYDDVKFVTPSQIRPNLRSRMLTVNGVSKAYAMTGWRIGYAVGPAALMQAIVAIISQSTSCACSIAQAAAAEALLGTQDVVERYRLEYAERRELVIRDLNAIPGLSCIAPKGAFYAFVDWKKLMGKTTEAGECLRTDEEFCRYLLDEYGVGVVPGAPFGAPGYFRVSFAGAIPVLSEGMALLRTACAALA